MAALVGNSLVRQLRSKICHGITFNKRLFDSIPLKTIPQICSKAHFSQNSDGSTKTPLKKPYTPVGKHDDPSKHRDAEKEPLAPFPDDINPKTGEKGGPRGPEPTRYGDWERKGRCIDF